MFYFNEAGKWNEALIEDNFFLTNSASIYNISLEDGFVEDSIMWHYDKKGGFLVKSVYKVA